MGSIFKRSKAGRWYANYFDAAGVRRLRSTGTRDKRAAEQIVAAWETDIAKQKAGLADPNADRIKEQQFRPITDHLSEYIVSLRSSGTSEEHLDRIDRHCKAIKDHARWDLLRDITPESLEKFTTSLKERKLSARTIGSYITSIRGFTAWTLRTHRSVIDALAFVRKPNPKTDRRLNRRMILPSEWPHLMNAITKPSFGMAPSDRKLLYEFAVQTALRSNEIRSLKVADVDTQRHIVSVRSSDTKDAEPAQQHYGQTLRKEWLGTLTAAR